MSKLPKISVSVEERLILHLYEQNHQRDRFLVTNSVTRPGIAEACALHPPNVSRIMRSLVSDSTVEEHMRSVRGDSRRQKTWQLPDVGEKTAEKLIDDTFVCVYGDSIFDFNLKGMIGQHKKKKSFITMSLYEYKTNLKYGVIETNKTGKVSAWYEKPEIKAKINMGCYVMEPGVFSFIPKKKEYGMDDVIKRALSRRKRVGSITTKKGFIDVGNMESYERANKEFRKRSRR